VLSKPIRLRASWHDLSKHWRASSSRRGTCERSSALQPHANLGEANMLMFKKPAAATPISKPASALTHHTTAQPGMAVGRFFVPEKFQFQTVRALMQMANGGADLNEVLETLKLIRDGDVQSWYAGWSGLSDRILALAESYGDKISAGNAYMRAHNY